MATEVNLGEFEQLVLLAILRLEDQAYGVTIRAVLERIREGSLGDCGPCGFRMRALCGDGIRRHRCDQLVPSSSWFTNELAGSDSFLVGRGSLDRCLVGEHRAETWNDGVPGS